MISTKIRILALDLEGTLISNAVSQIPRPGLYAFLQWCLTSFEEVVVFTAVSTPRTRAILMRMEHDREVPEGFGQAPIIDWSGDHKDLHFIPNASPSECLLVDDLSAYVLPSQRDQWVAIDPFSAPYSEEDRALEHVQEHIQRRLGSAVQGEEGGHPLEVILGHYTALVARIDDFTERVHARWGGEMRCRLGCTACCRQDLSVSRLEADVLLSWLEEQPQLPTQDPALGPHDDHALFYDLSHGTPCVFLSEGGGCGVYPVRPIICRSHGLPIQTQEGTSACRLNFEGNAAGAMITQSDILDIETVNTALAVLNVHWAHACALPEEASADRVPLSALRSFAETLRTES